MKNKTKSKKKVYIGMSADIVHEGHINILNIGSKLGKVTVGLLTDTAIASYKKIPILNYKKRESIVKHLKMVENVTPQYTLDYTENLEKFKPDFVVHGDDWKYGVQKNIRNKVIKCLKKWGGKLIEPTYTKNISSSSIKERIKEVNYGSNRVSILKRLLESNDIVRVLECHNPIGGMVVENTKIIKGKKTLEFDAMWSSSLTDSFSRGKPDNQSVDYSTRISGLNEIMEVTSKPIIFDADNGGRVEHLKYLIHSLSRSGVSAAIIEDKIGLKKNSLFKDQSNTKQDSIKNFCKKIRVACKSRANKDFLVIARVESFICNKGTKDALKRAIAYSKAGADAILIHSKIDTPSEIFEFSKKFKKSNFFKPLVAVPSSYSKVYEKDLIKNNFKVVIYANHLLRSVYPAMIDTAKTILKNQRAKETEKKITPIKKIISIID